MAAETRAAEVIETPTQPAGRAAMIIEEAQPQPAIEAPVVEQIAEEMIEAPGAEKVGRPSPPDINDLSLVIQYVNRYTIPGIARIFPAYLDAVVTRDEWIAYMNIPDNAIASTSAMNFNAINQRVGRLLEEPFVLGSEQGMQLANDEEMADAPEKFARGEFAQEVIARRQKELAESSFSTAERKAQTRKVLQNIRRLTSAELKERLRAQKAQQQ